MGDFRMPSLGADMDAGTVVAWRVGPGDEVHRGDIIAVVDTDKSDIEVEVFEDGVVEELLVEPGREVPVGTVLARIRPTGAEPAGAPPAAGPTARRRRPGRKVRPATAPVAAGPALASRAPRPATAPVAAGPALASRAPRPVEAPFVRASPLARREARAQGMDLEAIPGSGPGGAVVATDLIGTPDRPAPLSRAPESPTPAAPAVAPREGAPPETPATTAHSSAMRRAVGALMARSKREIPHYYLATTIDLSAAVTWLADANAARPVAGRVLPAALLLKATASAARQVPVMNGFWDGEFRPSASVHLGVAVSLRGGGLVAPAIHDADRLDLDQLMDALRDLVRRARGGVLRSSEMADPTITVTNLGDQGVEEVFGVIYPPQVALVGFGKVIERPWASAGMIGVRPVVRATLSADHRVSDGHDGARFLASIDRLLQNPEGL